MLRTQNGAADIGGAKRQEQLWSRILIINSERGHRSERIFFRVAGRQTHCSMQDAQNWFIIAIF